MVIRILVEGGIISPNPTLSPASNGMIAQNSAQLRQSLNEFFSSLFRRNDIEIKVTVASGKNEAYKQFVSKQVDDYFYVDLDRKPINRNDWFLEMDKVIAASPQRKSEVFFWIQEMEAWFLKQPSALNKWTDNENILRVGDIDLANDSQIIGKTPSQIENMQHKPSRVLSTIFKRHLIIRKNGKDRTLVYGKLRHAPGIIRFLDPQDLMLKDNELANFYQQVTSNV